MTTDRRTRRIVVLYFGGAKDAANAAEEQLALPPEVRTVSELAALLETRHEGLRGRLSGVRFAVNEAFVAESAPVSDGDVVAVIPPVSGG